MDPRLLVWVMGRALGWKNGSLERGRVWRVIGEIGIGIVERIRREETLMKVVAEREIGFDGLVWDIAWEELNVKKMR